MEAVILADAYRCTRRKWEEKVVGRKGDSHEWHYRWKTSGFPM
jgi:hypothetical protein